MASDNAVDRGEECTSLGEWEETNFFKPNSCETSAASKPQSMAKPLRGQQTKKRSHTPTTRPVDEI
jgi:hypothetical protein